MKTRYNDKEWAILKALYNKNSRQNVYRGAKNPIIGELAWHTPDDVLWLQADIRDEDYESSAEQWGVDKNGYLVWAYFSHCSCHGYEEYDNSYKQVWIDGAFPCPNRFDDLWAILRKLEEASKAP